MGRTLLHIVADSPGHGHECILGMPAAADSSPPLLDRGADLNCVGDDHRTPCDATHEGGDDTLIEWLRERGAGRAIDLI